MQSDAPTSEANQEKSLPNRLAGEQIRRILIVDDAQFLGLGLQRALRTAGIESVCTTSGVRALELLGRQSFAAVLTDLRMPEMSGEDLLAYLQQSRPDLPCLVMTGYATRECIERVARYKNVLTVLVKPLEYNRLFAAIEEVLSGKGRPAAAGRTPTPAPAEGA